jgi:APA family basic amino acid/polyamine antiporter
VLSRQVGVGGAAMLGLGSILGTGVFVSLGLAAGLAGPAVVVAVPIAAGLALCNAMSSAQLAAAHPVSGGTYEYGYRLLSPALGFSAGWMFLLAKSASAATAALGLAGYVLAGTGLGGEPMRLAVALLAVGVLTVLVLTGLRRSSGVNVVVVSVTVAALLGFVGAGLAAAWEQGGRHFAGFFRAPAGEGGLAGLLKATALMFVAYTGYGRVATLGEEIEHPGRNIPRAILVTVGISALLYLGVAAIGVGAVGAPAFAAATKAQAAPLQVIARHFGDGGLFVAATGLVAVGAIAAMLGVLLNLILGLSRVVLAMSRREDLPSRLSFLTAGRTPAAAILLTAGVIGALVCVGRVELTWSFSALTVLIYYGLTNLAALRLPREARRYPRGFAWAGLIGCLGLAVWIGPIYWMVGGGLLALGLGGRGVARWRSGGER